METNGVEFVDDESVDEKAGLTDAEKLRYIADWLDRVDQVADSVVPDLQKFGFGGGSSVMQDDLRRIAEGL